LNNIKVGYAPTPVFAQVFGSVTQSTLATEIGEPASTEARAFHSGANYLQWPHHLAKKSTNKLSNSLSACSKF